MAQIALKAVQPATPNTQTTHRKGLTVNTTENIQPAPNIAPANGPNNTANQPTVNPSPTNIPTHTPLTTGISGTPAVTTNTVGTHHTHVPKVKGRSSLRRASFAPMVSIYTPVNSSTTSSATGHGTPAGNTVHFFELPKSHMPTLLLVLNLRRILHTKPRP